MNTRTLLSFGLLLVAALSLAIAQDTAEEAGSGGAGQYQLWCAACHMSDGSGAEGAGVYPNVADNPNVEASADFVIVRVLNGFGAMPPFRSLSDEGIANIVNYLRVELNDAEDEIDAEAVEALR